MQMVKSSLGRVIGNPDVGQLDKFATRMSAFDTSIRKRQQMAPKFYLFDLGVR